MNNDWNSLLQKYPHSNQLCEIFRIGLSSQFQRYQNANELMRVLLDYRALVRGSNEDLIFKLDKLDTKISVLEQKIAQNNQMIENLGLT